MKCNKPTYFDVDDTLILWDTTQEQRDKYGISFVNSAGETRVMVPHLPNIEELKKHFDRGHTVIVWSAGGDQWVDQAIELLGLQKYVSLTLEKPAWHYDDKDCTEFMGKRYCKEPQK